MKKLFTIFTFILFFGVNAQAPIVPGDATLETKWIKKEKYQMKWYIVQDTEKHEVARINTVITPWDNDLTIVSNVDVNNAKTKWTDSTITILPSLAPVRHYSSNIERMVRLKFGNTVTGDYSDKVKKTKVKIDEAAQKGQYFDSNLIPFIVRMLPLKDDYAATIAAYDYSPAKSGVVITQVQSVKTGTYTNKSGLNVVWVVTTVETVKGITTQVKYFIDKSDRKIFKQEIFDGAMHTLIERAE